MPEGAGPQKAPLGEVADLTQPTHLQELGDAIDIAQFSCGRQTLDEWLIRRAMSSDGKTARTYVVCSGNRVAGYYCISAGSVERSNWPPAFRRNVPDPLPVIVLGRLAVDQEFQGRGLGADMLRHSFTQCLAAADMIGVRAQIVHPLDEIAKSFYEKYGYRELPGSPHAMFLAIETIVEAFAL